MLLVHGARSVLWATKSKNTTDRLYIRALKIQAFRKHNTATAHFRGIRYGVGLIHAVTE